MIYSNDMTNRAATAAKMHRAATMTAEVVAQAQRVRGLTRAEAVALVALRTGATVAQVQALLAFGAQSN